MGWFLWVVVVGGYVWEWVMFGGFPGGHPPGNSHLGRIRRMSAAQGPDSNDAKEVVPPEVFETTPPKAPVFFVVWFGRSRILQISPLLVVGNIALLAIYQFTVSFPWQ